MQNFRRGRIKNPYDITVAGVGYLGVGKYKVSKNCKHNEPYREWMRILVRCYDESQRFQYSSYAECTVCEEWKCYQNFAQWYEDNFYDIGEGRMHLDKDIIYEGNKLYSPETCIFVPQRINMIFMTRTRKYDLPTGIHKNDGGAKYHVMYNTTYLGSYDDLEKATDIYKTEKRKHIRNVADEYKVRIPKNVYDVLISW